MLPRSELLNSYSEFFGESLDVVAAYGSAFEEVESAEDVEVDSFSLEVGGSFFVEDGD